MDLQTDHTMYVTAAIIVCVLALAFGLLHMAAAASQYRKDHRATHLVMLIGALGPILAVLACLFGWGAGWNLDSLLMAIGGGAVCGAAWYNGKSAAARSGEPGRFHLSHHLIRFGVVLILVFSFIKV